MAVRPKEVYRGKHRRRNIVTILLFIVAVLVVGAVVMFYSFQKYIVYGQDGVSLELPILATPAPTDESGGTADFETVNAELVIDPADYSAVAATAGEDLAPLKGLLVPAASVSEAGIAEYESLMASYGANALVLEVKPDSGQLVYASGVSTAASYGLSGAFDLQAQVTALKDKGIYLAALVSCCTDNLLATRNPLIALRNAYGGVYTDTSGMWLDPYSSMVRDYIRDLSLELAQMGFDEVILRNLAHPVTDDALVYSETLSSTPTPAGGVSGFAVSLSSAMTDSGAVLSAVLSADTLHNGLSDKTGQDAELFFKVFDRVCGPADSAWQYGADRDALSAYITVGEAAMRWLPVMSYAPDGASCWIVNVPDSVPEEE